MPDCADSPGVLLTLYQTALPVCAHVQPNSAGTTSLRNTALIKTTMLPHTVTGTGKTALLFLHYFGGSQRTWSHVVDSLSKDHRCITADLPGFGDAAVIPGYTVADMQDAVRELVASLAPSPVVLIGHSMGGKVAMTLAAEPPENLQQVILVAPSPLVPEPMTEEQRATMTVANETREGAQQFVKNGALALSEADVQTGVEDVLRANEEAWKAWPQHGTREDWSQRITKFAVRTDLIVGEHDEAIPLPFQRKHTLPLVEVSGGTLITIPNAAHMLPYEAPRELAVAIATAMPGQKGPA